MKTQLLCAVSLLIPVGLLGCNTVIKPQPVPPAGIVLSFTASPAELAMAGEKATISWSTENATHVGLEHVGQGPVAIDARAASGTVEVTLNEDALFVLTARGPGGTDSKSTSVQVKGGMQGVVFDAVPRTIAAGGVSTLVWSAPGAMAVTLTEVGGAPINLGGQVQSGSVQVGPSKSTSYELDADGKKLTVAVEVGIAIYGFEQTGAAPLPGQSVALTWQTSGGSKLTLTREGVTPPLMTETDPTKVVSGTFNDLVPAGAPVDGLLHYKLELEQGALKISQPLVVRVGGSVKVTELLVPAYAKASGIFVAQWKTTGGDRLELWVDDVRVYLAPDAATVASGNRTVQAPAAGVVKVKVVVSNQRGAVAELEKTTAVVGATSIATFTATPAVLPAGGSPVTLAWTAPSARRIKITGSDGHTVATTRGVGAESGTATVFPNAAITYTLEADNTLDPVVTASQAVTVTAPAAFGEAVPSAVLAGNPIVLTWAVGTNAQVYGAAHSTVQTQTASTGFVDISATGTRLAFAATADDAVQTFTPPDFETFLYGTRVSGAVTVSTNGFLVFAASAASRSTPVAIPNATIERNFVAPFWTNLELASVGTIGWQVMGEAPERVLVVQFDKLKVKGDASSELTFQARIHQTGVVTFEYLTLNATALPAAVIGVQGLSSGLAATGAAAKVGLTLFGPKSAPVTVTPNTALELGGFLKLAGGYLKGVYAPTAFAAANDVQISEVLYQANAAIENTGEWFEVTNRANGPIDLNGWTIEFAPASSHLIASSVVVPAGGAVVLSQSATGPANDDVVTGYVYGTPFVMPQPVGTLTLRKLNYLAASSWNSATTGNGGVGVSIGVDTQSFLVSTDTSSTLPHSLRCSSTLTFGSQTPLQKGSPGASAGCFGYAKQSIPVSYFDISGTGAVATTGDDAVGTVDLTAAPVSFFGAARSTSTVSTNGWFTFKTTTSSGFSNRSVPSTSAANAGTLAIFWDDLNDTGSATSNVYSKRVAAAEDPNNPGAHWIIQWGHYTHLGAGDDLNFQVKLFDSGVIEYHYAAMTSGSASNYANGNSATVWLENYAGNTALISSLDQPSVVPMSALRFTPN